MEKKKKKKVAKYYAVKKGVKSMVIVRTWDECSKLVTGYPGAVYKSFTTEEEALAFLQGVEPSQKATQTEMDLPDIVSPIRSKKRLETAVEPNKGISKGTVHKKQAQKGNLVSVNFSLPREVVAMFEEKCNDFKINRDMIITSMLKEWVI